MEQLSKIQAETVKKMGQTRLMTKLREAGISEEAIDAMDRQAMLTAWAECIIAGKDKPQPTAGLGYDVELERKKLEFEMQRFAAQEKVRVDEGERAEKLRATAEKLRLDELARSEKLRLEELARAEKAEKLRLDELARSEKLRLDELARSEKLRLEELERADKARMAVEKLRLEELARAEKAEKLRLDELELRREELERAEKVRMDEAEKAERIRVEGLERDERIRQEEWDRKRDLKRMEIEAQENLKQTELRQLRQKQLEEQEQRETMVSRAKRYGDAIKASLAPMGTDALEMVAFFRHLEAIYERYKVPADLQADLLQPYVNSKSRALVARMDPLLSKDYTEVRDLILREHKLTPATYLEYFNSIACDRGETCVMFCSRLKALFEQYLASRQVVDLAGLISLTISDRIKSTLSDGTLRHILSVEAASEQGFPCVVFSRI